MQNSSGQSPLFMYPYFYRIGPPWSQLNCAFSSSSFCDSACFSHNLRVSGVTNYKLASLALGEGGVSWYVCMSVSLTYYHSTMDVTPLAMSIRETGQIRCRLTGIRASTTDNNEQRGVGKSLKGGRGANRTRGTPASPSLPLSEISD